MIRITNFLRRYGLLVLISLAAVLFIVNKVLGPEKTTPTPSVTPFTNRVADYRSLVPGKSSLEEVNNLLGFPVKKSEEDGKVIAEYESSNEFRNNIVILQNGVATLIKEVVNTPDNKNSKSITEMYGEAPYLLYDQSLSASFHLYTYPENGIAYLGHVDGTVLEIWYFEPTTLENFLSRWGEGFGREESKEIPQY